MAIFSFELPDIKEDDLRTEKGIKAVMDYLYMLNEQLKYTLSHLSLDENLDADSVMKLLNMNKSINLSAEEIEMQAKKIEANAEEILLRAKKGELSAEISLEDGEIRIEGNRLIINSTNFSLDCDGTVTCHSGVFDSAVFEDVIQYQYLYNGELYRYPILYVENIGTLSLGGSDMHTNVKGSMNVDSGRLYVGSISIDNLAATRGYVSNYAANNCAPVSHTHQSTSIIPVLTSAGNVSIQGSDTLATGTWVRANFQRIDSSDFRLKRDMQKITENDMAILSKLKCYRFRYKDETEDDLPHFGVLAQEVLSAMEELGIDISDQSIVTEYETRSYKDEGMYAGEKAYRVNYNELSKLLLAAWQKDHEELNMLREDMYLVKRELEEMKSLVKGE